MFANKTFIYRFYSSAKALLTTYKAKIINKKKFVKMILEKNVIAFIVYITSFNLYLMLIYHAWKFRLVYYSIKKLLF